MRIGLIDVDGHNYPNIPLMKISAYHKSLGDDVEMVIPIENKNYDKVYMSKVFSFSPDYPYHINADEISRGGQGMQYILLMEKKYMTRVLTGICRAKSNISILITHCIRSTQKILHTDSVQEVAQEDVLSAM